MSRTFSSFAFVAALLVGCRPAHVPAPDVAKTRHVPPRQPPEKLVAPDGSDPVALLQPILARLAHERPPATVFQTGADRWHKRQMVVVGLTYDVRKTDALDAPFEAMVPYSVAVYVGPECTTQEAAAASTLPDKPLPRNRREPWAKFRYQDGGWTVADCGWENYYDDFSTSHSNNRLADPSVDQWWAYFGGR